MSETETYLRFAQEIVEEAGRLTLGYFRRRIVVEEKGDGSPVTIADREAEALIRREIERRFPDHGIVGEEHGTKEPRNGSSYRWIIDPIDGTKSFIHGVPMYTSLLGLQREDTNVVGVIGIPALGEQVSAAKGLGCWANGHPARVSATSEIRQAVVLFPEIQRMHWKSPYPGWNELFMACKYCRGWGDGYGYAMVATGRADVMMDTICAPYDIACMPVILEEAGGRFTDWSGAVRIDSGHSVATNGVLHETVLGYLRGGPNG